MLTIQNYVRPASAEEAYELNQNRRNRIIGGMLWLKMSSAGINTAIDLCSLGLDRIEETPDEFIIGASVTLRQLETHTALNSYTCGAAAEAVRNIVGVQFRNMATVGGSIWGRYGFSDVLTLMLSLDSYAELHKAGRIPMAEFSRMPWDRDVLLRIIIKKRPGRFVYGSMRNQRTDLPVLTSAISCINGEYRAVIGARPGRAILLRDECALLNGGINEKSAGEFAEYIAANTPTGSNSRAGAQYRSHLAKVLVQRGAIKLGGML